MIYLETERLNLRDYSEQDLDQYFKLKSDKKVMYYLQDIKLQNIQHAKEDLQMVLDDLKSENRKFYFFHMEDKINKEQIGSIGYTVMEENIKENNIIEKQVHLGYFIYSNFWNHGFVTEALNKILKFAFMENNVYQIKTGCLKENRASERVMQKCGFLKQTEFVDYEMHDGIMKTRVEYSLLKQDYLLLF